MNRAEILHEAEKCVCTDRQEQYGSPESNFGLIAELWQTYLRQRCVSSGADVCILPDDVAVMMALLKIARIATGQTKPDNYIDLAGYAACAGEIACGGEPKKAAPYCKQKQKPCNFCQGSVCQYRLESKSPKNAF